MDVEGPAVDRPFLPGSGTAAQGIPGRPSFFVLLLLISLASVCAVFFTPALPEVARRFDVSRQTAQLTVSVFLLGYALGQLPYGPLSNRFGRKKTIYIGLGLQIMASVLCAVASHLGWFALLVAGRFLTALGASVGLVLSLTIIGDCYGREEAQRITGYLITAFAAMPGVSTAVGGYVVQYSGFQSCFYALIAYGSFVALASATLPETGGYLNPVPIEARALVRTFWELLWSRKLLANALLVGGATACDYIYVATMPFLASTIGLRPSTYGALNAIPILGLMVGSLLSARLARVLSARQGIVLGLGLASAGALVMLLLFATVGVNIGSLFVAPALVFCGISCVYSCASALFIVEVADKANGSALVSFVNIITAMSGVYAVGFFARSSLACPIAFLCFAGLMWTVYLVGLTPKTG